MTDNPTQERQPSDALHNMVELITRHWKGNRSAVNSETDLLIEEIRGRLDCSVREFPAGQEVLTWVIPHRWHVREARLEDTDGTVIADYAANPLHLWTNSVSFSGEVSRKELEQHLFHNPNRPTDVPYHFINGYRYNPHPDEWGFSLSTRDYEKLTASRYNVHIDTDVDTDGTMKVIDHVLPGNLSQTVFFAAHSCHPAQVTDGLSDVAILVELFARLANRRNRRYTYQLIVGPEYFTAAAFLAETPRERLKQFVGGIYLDMIGNGQKWAFSTSFQKDTLIDRVLANVIRHHTNDHAELAHRKLGGNDEMFYNGPGFDIPTAEFGCSLHPEHHTSGDNMDFLDREQIKQALLLVERVVDVLETDFVPLRKFEGPLYLSRYDLYMPLQENEHVHDVQERLQVLMDGRRSCFDLAHELGADYDYVRAFCEALEKHNLIERI